MGDEMVMMCKYLFGSDAINTLPDPHTDWCGYSKGLEKLLEGETLHWEYADKSFKKWINVQVLNQVYGNSARRMSSPLKHINKAARGLESERLSRVKEGVRIFRLNASFTSPSIFR